MKLLLLLIFVTLVLSQLNITNFIDELCRDLVKESELSFTKFSYEDCINFMSTRHNIDYPDSYEPFFHPQACDMFSNYEPSINITNLNK